MHHRSVVRAAATAVGTAGLVTALSLPGAAFAATYRHSDPAKDVQQVGSSQQVSNAPTNETSDVVHLKVVHTRKHVQTTLKMRDLGKSWLYVSVLKTAATTYQLTGYRQSGTTTYSLTTSKGTAVTCDVVGGQDRTKHTVTVTVPDSCLGTPHWVKVGAGFAVPTKNSGFYADDAQRRHHADESQLALSKRIHRG